MKKNKSFLISLFIILAFIIVLSFFLISYNQKMIEEKNLIDMWHQNGNNLITYKTPSLFFVYIDLLQNTPLSILMFLPPVLVIITGLYDFFKIVKSGYIKYIANFRMKYKKFINKQIFKCYKYAFIVPIMYIISIIGCGILTNFNAEISSEGLDMNAFSISFNSPIILILATALNLFLADIFYINIGLLTVIKSKNLLLNNIFSYLIIIIFSIVFELIIGYGLAFITGNYLFANLFNFYNIWYPIDCQNVFYLTIYLSLISISSSFIVLVVYKNEERILANV